MEIGIGLGIFLLLYQIFGPDSLISNPTLENEVKEIKETLQNQYSKNEEIEIQDRDIEVITNPIQLIDESYDEVIIPRKDNDYESIEVSYKL